MIRKREDNGKNYTKEMDKLHQKQFESLPEEKQYKGGRTVDELLQDMAEGKTLDDAETEYVKIFANLKDFEKAQQKAELPEQRVTLSLQSPLMGCTPKNPMRLRTAEKQTIKYKPKNKYLWQQNQAYISSQSVTQQD